VTAVEWTELGILAGLFVSGFGYLSVRMERVESRLDDRMGQMEARITSRLDRLDERYVRHLETHAGH